MKKYLAFAVALAAMSAATAGAAPVPYTGGPYAQDFDGLPLTGAVTIPGIGPHDIQGVLGSTGLEGWSMSNYAGSSPSTEFRAQDGSQAGSAGRGVVSFGAAGSSDRALGVLATSNQISRFGVAFVNNTATTLNQMSAEFVVEQWRRGNVPSPGNSLAFAYAVTSDPTAGINDNALFTGVTSITAPNTQAAPTEVAIDGNAVANQANFAGTISGINWGPGEYLILRWTGQDITGQDDGLAVDNFSFRAAVPEPAGAAIAGLAVAMLGLHRKRR